MNLILTEKDKTVAIIDNIDRLNIHEIRDIIQFQADTYGRDWYIEGKGDYKNEKTD